VTFHTGAQSIEVLGSEDICKFISGVLDVILSNSSVWRRDREKLTVDVHDFLRVALQRGLTDPPTSLSAYFDRSHNRLRRYLGG
jgi:hypothetical protein